MIDEAIIRRIIREELDNYDRDKGITPRFSGNGLRAAFQARFSGVGDGYPTYPAPTKPLKE